jgi:hypothetical protein
MKPRAKIHMKTNPLIVKKYLEKKIAKSHWSLCTLI